MFNDTEVYLIGVADLLKFLFCSRFSAGKEQELRIEQLEELKMQYKRGVKFAM